MRQPDRFHRLGLLLNILLSDAAGTSPRTSAGTFHVRSHALRRWVAARRKPSISTSSLMKSSVVAGSGALWIWLAVSSVEFVAGCRNRLRFSGGLRAGFGWQPELDRRARLQRRRLQQVGRLVRALILHRVLRRRCRAGHFGSGGRVRAGSSESTCEEWLRNFGSFGNGRRLEGDAGSRSSWRGFFGMTNSAGGSAACGEEPATGTRRRVGDVLSHRFPLVRGGQLPRPVK